MSSEPRKPDLPPSGVAAQIESLTQARIAASKQIARLKPTERLELLHQSQIFEKQNEIESLQTQLVTANAELVRLRETEKSHERLDQLHKNSQTQLDEKKEELSVANGELDRLREIEKSHERLKQLHKSGRWIGAITVAAISIGGGLVSSFKPGDVWFGIGWGFIILAVVLQLGKCIADW